MNTCSRVALRAGILLTALLASSYSAALTLESAARNIRFANLSTEDGLSSEFVNDVAQDGRGYIWFATQSGLNRYDGHEVKVYEHRPDDPRSLSDNFLRALMVDSSGELWVGSERGLNRYDPTTDSFDRTPFGGRLAFARIRDVMEDSRGRIWVGTVATGLIGMERDGSDIRYYRNEPERPDSLPDDRVIAVAEDRRGNLWVGTDGGGLARLNRDGEFFTRFVHDPEDPASLGHNEIRSLYEDSEGRIWVGTGERGISRFNPDTQQFDRFEHDDDDPNSIGAGQVPAIFQDSAGTLWVGTESGLAEWRPSMAAFLTYKRDAANRFSIVNDRVNAIMQDASGVLWVATHGGVSVWNYVSDTFAQYGTEGGFLNSDIVTSIAEEVDGTVWVATYGGGLSRINLDTGDARHYRHRPDDPSSLGDDRVMAVHVDDSGTVWAGTRTGGLCQLIGDDVFTCYRSDPENPRSLSGNAVTSLFSDRDGSLWIGIWEGGLNRMSGEGVDAVFERFQHAEDNPQSISSNRVLTMAQDSQGLLWVGTESHGLNRLDLASGRVDRFDIEEYATDEGVDPVSGTPWAIHFTADGDMWIGTMAQGLLRWELRDRAAGAPKFQRYGLADGLASGIYGIAEGTDGRLWLSSSRGLFGFDPRRQTVRKFDRSNGLRNNEFNQGARLASQSGRLIFGGTAGLVAFSPRNLPFNPHPPAIDLLARSRTERLARSSASEVPQVELSYRDPFIAFDFVALDYVSPDKNAYRYRLQGYDNEWNESTEMRTAIYSNVPPGNYTFQVQGSNSNGVWNQEGASVMLTVTPPPWLTPLAYALYVTIAALALALFVRNQKRQKQQEVARRLHLEQLVSERTSELAARNEELISLNRQIEDASFTDQLTGLRNRRFVHRFIETDLSRLKRQNYTADEAELGSASPQGRLLFVIMVDLDGFKPINDRFGHEAGDQVLKAVSDRLNACCRASDAPVRWGGDEFLLFGYTDTFAGIQTLAEKVRAAICNTPYLLPSGDTATLSGSVGATAMPFVESDPELVGWEQVVAASDVAAYLAKNNGRDAWVSIRGSSLLTRKDLVDMKENLPRLVDSGKVVLDSSIGSELSFEDRTVARITSVA